MNKEYLKKFYEENKDTLMDDEIEINDFEDFENYIIDTITSNIQYDFDLDIDIEKLFKKDNTPSIDIEINNNGIMKVEQTDSDKARGGVALMTIDEKGNVARRDLIDEGDFVMLMNYYMYVKDNDIKDDFINLEGKNDRKDIENNYGMDM